MSESIIERVAKAISSPEIWEPENEKRFGDLWLFEEQKKAREKARKAFLALLNPTQAMIDAGNAWDGDWKHADQIYRAMIEEALK